MFAKHSLRGRTRAGLHICLTDWCTGIYSCYNCRWERDETAVRPLISVVGPAGKGGFGAAHEGPEDLRLL